jgi:hypothetical protein
MIPQREKRGKAEAETLCRLATGGSFDAPARIHAGLSFSQLLFRSLAKAHTGAVTVLIHEDNAGIRGIEFRSFHPSVFESCS